MTFEEIDRELRLCYGASQALLRFGFHAEDIYYMINFGRVLIVLRAPNKPEFVITACETTMTTEAFETKWSALVTAMQVDQTVTMPTREQMLDEFRGQFSGVGLVTGLMDKGLLPI